MAPLVKVVSPRRTTWTLTWPLSNTKSKRWFLDTFESVLWKRGPTPPPPRVKGIDILLYPPQGEVKVFKSNYLRTESEKRSVGLQRFYVVKTVPSLVCTPTNWCKKCKVNNRSVRNSCTYYLDLKVYLNSVKERVREKLRSFQRNFLYFSWNRKKKKDEDCLVVENGSPTHHPSVERSPSFGYDFSVKRHDQSMCLKL